MQMNDVEALVTGEAIERLVLADGMPMPSLRAIGSEAGIVHSTLADWFGSKEALVRRCGQEFARRHHDQLARIAASHGLVGLASPGVAASNLLRVRSMWIAWARMQDATEDLVEVIHNVEREVVRDALFWDGKNDGTEVVERAHAQLIASWEFGRSLLDPPNVRTAA